MSKFSGVLRELRKSKRLTQTELGHDLEVSYSTISMWERGEREPDMETLEAIADYFNVDMDFLIGKSDIPNKYQKFKQEKLVSERIKLQRENLGLTFEDIDRKLGVEKGTAKNLENGMIENIRIDKISTLARILQTSPAYLKGQETTTDRIKKRRRDLNMSKEEFAEKMEISVDEVNRYEETDGYSGDLIGKAARILETHFQYLKLKTDFVSIEDYKKDAMTEWRTLKLPPGQAVDAEEYIEIIQKKPAIKLLFEHVKECTETQIVEIVSYVNKNYSNIRKDEIL